MYYCTILSFQCSSLDLTYKTFVKNCLMTKSQQHNRAWFGIFPVISTAVWQDHTISVSMVTNYKNRTFSLQFLVFLLVFKNMWISNLLSFQISILSDLNTHFLILNVLFGIATDNWSFVCYAPTIDYLIISINSKNVPKHEIPNFPHFNFVILWPWPSLGLGPVERKSPI